MRPTLFDAPLFFDGFVGGGDAVEALAGLLLLVLAHVAHHVGVEMAMRRKAFLNQQPPTGGAFSWLIGLVLVNPQGMRIHLGT